MNETAELPLVLPAPDISPAEVESLVGVLRSAEGWLTAREIAARMAHGTTDRDVRAIASAARPVVVSYPGSPGYKLWQRCSVAEIDNCIAAFERQSREMTKGAVLYRQAYHRRFRGAPGDDIQAELAGIVEKATP
jgi:hypothetical protein